MERRDFFKLVTTASAGLATGACSKKAEPLIPLLVSEREVVPGEETWRPGICGECPAGCGVIVRLMEGERVIEQDGERVRQRIACVKKIEGNPLDPVSAGRLCARGQAAVQGLYHPDRLRGPMRRVGPRGKAELMAMPWDEAIAVAAEKLAKTRETDPSRILFLAGPQTGTRAMAIARFLEAIGAPPAVNFELSDFPVERKAAELLFGWEGLPVYDLANARYVLGVGADFLGGWASPVYYARQFGHFRQGRPGIRGTLVQAESRLSITAQSADSWVPLRPGTEPLFLGALTCLILEMNLARKPDAVPPAVVEGFKSVDVAGAIRECGIDAFRLRRVARELGESEAPLVMAGASIVHTNSLDALIAAGYLNLLLGNVGQPGGVLPPAPKSPLGTVPFANAVPALQKAEFLFTDRSNPAYTLPWSTGVLQKLENIQTMVTFSPFLDDSGAYADLLLPDHHGLESSMAVAPPVAPAAAVAVASPFIEPLYETRATEQVLAQIAKAIGVEVDVVMPRAALQGFVPPDLSWEEVTRQGGFWGEPAPQPPGGPPNRQKPVPPPLAMPAPSFTGDPEQYPFLFQPYLSLQYGDGRSANLPWLQELPDPVSSAMWELPVEVDPQTAARMGLRNGDRVRVESPHGSIEAPAYVHPGAVPGVLSMGIGKGHRHFGRYASNRGANPLAILAPVWEKSTGALALGATRVKLSRLASGRLIQFSPNDREHNPFGYR